MYRISPHCIFLDGPYPVNFQKFYKGIIVVVDTDSGPDRGQSYLFCKACESWHCQENGGQFKKERILSDVLEKMNISERYDLILLNCPPSLGLVTVNALVAADEVYVPIAPEVFPLKGLVKLEEIFSMVSARLNPGIDITGVIVTMFNSTKNLFVTVDEELRGIYGDKVFRTRIRENVKLAECPMHRTEITSYAPESNEATDYVNLAKEILARLDGQQ